MEGFDLVVGGVEAEHPRDLFACLGLVRFVECAIEACADAVFGLVDDAECWSAFEIQHAEHVLLVDIPVVGRKEEVAVGADIAGEVEVWWGLDVECGAHVLDSSGVRLVAVWAL